MGWEIEMPDDPSLESRASAAECLRLAASTTNPTSRAALLLLAQKWMEKANKLAGRNLGPDALLPDTDKRRGQEAVGCLCRGIEDAGRPLS
jgi:hypothetical protein